eukprot:scaffold13800_cov51-Cyclotella_meneghiniana.AAC.6
MLCVLRGARGERRGTRDAADGGGRKIKAGQSASRLIDVDMTSLCPTMMTYVSLQPAPAVARVLKEHNHEIIVSLDRFEIVV